MDLFTRFAPASDSRVPRRRSIRREGCGVTARVRACTRSKALTATSSVVLAAGLLAVSTPAQAAAGYLDTSFSGDGTLVTDFGDVTGPDIAIQDDGRIVAVGRAGSDFALARYNPDGSLDLTFSGDGKLTTDFGGSDQARAVVIQADDKIVVAGWGDSADFALARYSPDGSLDPTFAGDGKLTTDFGGGDGAEDVVVQSDGKFVAAGRSNSDTALARYNPDGSLDTTFAGDGKHTTAFGGGAAGVAIQVDDRIVTAGRDGSDFALARFSPDGSPDASFSGDGRQSTDFGGDDSASDLAIQPDGRIVVAGTAVRPFGPFPYGDFALARYNADGSLDASFGSGGTRTQDFNWYEDGAAVAIQANGKLVVAGGQTDPYGFPENGAWFQSAIYRADGSNDQTLPFADFVGDVDCCAHTHATAVAIQDDGKIVIAGATSGWSVTGFAIARYQGGSEPPGTAPTNTSPPTISGSADEGQTLTINSGVWSGSTPIDHSYQWRLCDSAVANCVDIAAATATTYTLTASDVGRTIRVREAATNAYGAGSVDSAVTAVVKATAGAVAGTVRSASTGAAISGAGVNCGNGYSATTANNGAYSIANVTAGSRSCTASAKRYRASTRTVTVASGQTTTAKFSLARS
jgi:uncharacterized delta-60 repeat protein